MDVKRDLAVAYPSALRPLRTVTVAFWHLRNVRMPGCQSAAFHDVDVQLSFLLRMPTNRPPQRTQFADPNKSET